jgi:predicted Zn-dependent protease
LASASSGTVAAGLYDDAEAALERLARSNPDSAVVADLRADLAGAAGEERSLILLSTFYFLLPTS